MTKLFPILMAGFFVAQLWAPVSTILHNANGAAESVATTLKGQ